MLSSLHVIFLSHVVATAAVRKTPPTGIQGRYKLTLSPTFLFLCSASSCLPISFYTATPTPTQPSVKYLCQSFSLLWHYHRETNETQGDGSATRHQHCSSVTGEKEGFHMSSGKETVSGYGQECVHVCVCVGGVGHVESIVVAHVTALAWQHTWGL